MRKGQAVGEGQAVSEERSVCGGGKVRLCRRKGQSVGEERSGCEERRSCGLVRSRWGTGKAELRLIQSTRVGIASFLGLPSACSCNQQS